MNTNRSPGISKIALSAAMSAALAACGGGGDGNPTTSTSPTTTPRQLTGKAIDGYLAGATVCLDLNGNNSCDPGEPSTVTDGYGNFSLVADNAVGKKLLVVVDGNTRDQSRPGYRFPANLVLSGLVDGATGQNVTPLTSMVVAQMEAGASRAAAERSVAALVGAVDPKADYVAAGDQATLAVASRIVDKVTAFAKAGQDNAATVRAVLNAIAAKGDVAGVVQADVDAEAAKPVYALDTNVAELLAHPLFSYNHTRYENGVPTMVRSRWTLSGSQLVEQAEAYGATGWAALPAREASDDLGEYFLTSAGAWSRFYAAAEMLKPISVQAVDNASLSLADAAGYTGRLEFRRLDASGKAFDALPDAWLDGYPQVALSGAFAPDSMGYLGLLARDQDWISVPSHPCDGGTTPITEDGVAHCNYIGVATQQYRSVDEAIGLDIPYGNDRLGNPLTLKLSANGVAQIVNQATQAVVVPATKIRWSKYSRNANIIVLDVAVADIEGLQFPFGDEAFAQRGGKVLIALHNGHLKYGQMEPATLAHFMPTFRQPVFDQLAAAIRAGLGI
ncbi:hypothetical protein [Ralstonia pseudosolanacearum]|uniref:hypothetical protein n=1 Tax=Ralstonia pseudosolanacearum TaxID=1310165 RepID=UPI00201E61F2|nr:hypothetical protein [Ralstonia pseudosolanacearum]UQY83016.1 hypothetical protein JNO62_02405 [Ralstonia pseudosolanacearum]